MTADGELAHNTQPVRCAHADKDCWGKVATYSFDIDLPTLTLCEAHVWDLMAPPDRKPTLYEKAAIAEAIEGKND